jgi:SAM-dependent methyltransferase
MIRAGSVPARLARAVVRRGLRVSRLRQVVQGELARATRVERTENAAPARAPVELGTFVDRHGMVHALDPTLRDRLKPSWRMMCDPAAVAQPPSDEALRGRARKAVTSVLEAERMLELVARESVTGRMLEIGCYDGAVAFELSRRPGARVVGSDLARYYVVQRPGEPADDAVTAEQAALAALRERARLAAAIEPDRVEFVEDDITASTLETDSFDRILSFEVLEHVRQPAAAFRSMAALLRPGGLIYHDYNPFLSANGGHSLVTLDFAWGHARLDDEDVERYLREIRPTETDQALRFYRESLNRMTLADLRTAVTAAGLELLALVPWYDRGLLPQASRQALDEVRRTYPTATQEDLLATFVAVVARRPGGYE